MSETKEVVQEWAPTAQEYRALEEENARLREALETAWQLMDKTSNTGNGVVDRSKKAKAAMQDAWGDYTNGRDLDEVTTNLFIPLTYQQNDEIERFGATIVFNMNTGANNIKALLKPSTD